MRSAKELFEELNIQDETVQLEAKGAHELGRTVLESVSSFSNEPNLGGGYILIGAAKDEESLFPTYIAEDIGDTDKIQSDLATQCSSTFNIPVRPLMKIEQVNGKNVLVVRIEELPESQKPLYFTKNGLPQGAYRRTGPTDHKCTDDDLRVFYSDTTDYDKTVLNRTSLQDLDEKAIEQYRNLRAKVNPSAEELTYSDDELLLALGCLDVETRKYLTLAGLLLFGSKAAQRRELPIMRCDYIRVPGKVWVEDPDDRFRTIDMRGPLITLLFRLVDEVNGDLPKGFKLAEGDVQASSAGLPVKALREIIVNALMHRNYRENTPIQLIRYDNRLEVRNPGYSLKNEEFLGEPGSTSRNPTLAAVFHETNLAETKGSGIRAVRKLLKQAHLAPPTFESDRLSNQFTTHLLLHHFLSEEDLFWLKSFEKIDLNDSQKQALILVRELGAITNSSYRQLSELDSSQASRDLRQLCSLDLLMKKGKKKGAYYIAGPSFIAETVALNTEPQSLNTEPQSLNTEPQSLNTEPQSLNTEAVSNQLKLLDLLPNEIIGQLGTLKSRESDKEKVSNLIVAICKVQPFSLSELAIILRKGENYLSREYLKPMLGKKIDYVFPDVVNHPEQKYKSR
jgi:ATP-dependent DNA helicase RecG